MTKTLGLMALLSVVAMADTNPKFSCFNHHFNMSLGGKNNETLRISSEDKRPLLPNFDVRIRTMEVGPIPCGTAMSGAIVCFTDACRYERYYDFNGNEITDVEGTGEVSFTAVPEWHNDPKTGQHSRYLVARFQINTMGTKHIVGENFEIWPGKYCGSNF